MLGCLLTSIVGRHLGWASPINVLDMRIQHDPRVTLRNTVAHHGINQAGETSRMLVRDEPTICPTNCTWHRVRIRSVRCPRRTRQT